MDSISMLSNDTWFDVPFNLPFEVVHMPNTDAVLVIEATPQVAAKLSVYINKAAVTESRTMVPRPEQRQTYEIAIPLRKLRMTNRITIGVSGQKKSQELFHLHRLELQTRLKVEDT